jgi:hypothetical protein
MKLIYTIVNMSEHSYRDRYVEGTEMYFAAADVWAWQRILARVGRGIGVSEAEIIEHFAANPNLKPDPARSRAIIQQLVRDGFLLLKGTKPRTIARQTLRRAPHEAVRDASRN